jgi:uncharacterized protein
MTSQEEKLLSLVGQNTFVLELIHAIPSLDLPNCYVAGACIAQTLWSLSHGFEAHHGIKDIDLVYFEGDLSQEKEQREQARVKAMFAHFPMEVDVINEARVHLWYKSIFGYSIQPYTSVEEAISTFPITASTLGVRRHGNSYDIYAPLGLEDVLNNVVRPNKKQIIREIYEAKLERWQPLWPNLSYLFWDNSSQQCSP